MDKMTLEKLLNILCEKGWKPFGIEKEKIWFNGREDRKIHLLYYEPLNYKNYTLRELVSKESGLWQFVCENGMIKEDEDKKEERYMYECEYNTGSHSTTNYFKQNIYTKEYFYRYFIIENALCDEDKLEEFLLKNIKVE